jgi:hypothetical protein
MGPPPSPSSLHNLRPPRPSHLASGHPFLYLYTHPQFFIYLALVQSLCFQHLHSFSSSPLTTFFLLANTTHVSLGWGIHYILLLLTSSTNPEYPTGQLPLLSEFVHFVPPLAQLIPRLVIPLTLDLIVRLLPLHIYPQPREVLSLQAS